MLRVKYSHPGCSKRVRKRSAPPSPSTRSSLQGIYKLCSPLHNNSSLLIRSKQTDSPLQVLRSHKSHEPENNQPNIYINNNFTMEFTNIILAATATILVAACPAANPIDTSPNVANADVFAREDCKKCNEFVDNCMKVSLTLPSLLITSCQHK